MATGHEKRSGGGGSQGGAGSIAPEKKKFVSTMISSNSPVDVESQPVTVLVEELKTHFWPWLTLTCHLRQILVGANMRPDRHMLPKAA